MEILALPLIGMFAGFSSGLFGIGGGSIIVPTLIFYFHYQGINSAMVPSLAIASSLAMIIFTSTATTYVHYRKGNLAGTLFKHITPSILIGAMLGGIASSYIPGDKLQKAFALFLMVVSVQMLFGKVAKPHRGLPGILGLNFFGIIIGMVSATFGIGGAILFVPLFTACNLPVKKAIGTAPAINVLIALSATVANIVTGWNVQDLPYGNIGYINLPIVGIITIASISMVPLGARLSHSLPEKKLKGAFALLLILISIELFLSQ